jgi:hypothetical protein
MMGCATQEGKHDDPRNPEHVRWKGSVDNRVGWLVNDLLTLILGIDLGGAEAVKVSRRRRMPDPMSGR